MEDSKIERCGKYVVVGEKKLLRADFKIAGTGEKMSQNKKEILDKIAKILHSHWTSDRNAYIIEELPDKVQHLKDELDKASEENKMMRKALNQIYANKKLRKALNQIYTNENIIT